MLKSANYIRAIFALAIFVITGCSYNTPEDVDLNITISKEDFLKLYNIELLDDLKSHLGIHARHKFTLRSGDHEYCLILCNVDGGDSTYFFWVLYKDGKFNKVVEYVQSDREVYTTSDGSRVSREVAWQFINNKKAIKHINSPSIARDIASDRVDAYVNDKTVHPGENNNKLIKFFVGNYMLSKTPWEKVRKQIKKNEGLLKQYNALNLELGMSKSEVHIHFGDPTASYALSNEITVYVYGDSGDHSPHPDVTFHPVCVGFDKNGRVYRIFSNRFYDSSWLEQESDSVLPAK